MAFDGLLSQIANPQTADIAGAIDFRQKRLQEEQQRQKDAKMKELFSQSVLPNLREGSIQYEMAKEDPERAIAYFKAIGIPLDQAHLAEQESKDVFSLANIMEKDGPQGALEYARSLIEQKDASGLNTDKHRQWLDAATQEFQTTGTLGRYGNAIKMKNESLNADLIAQAKAAQRKAELEERGMRLKEAELGLKAKELSMGGGENAGVQSSNILDDGTVIQVLKSGGTRVVDPAGNVLSGAARSQAIKDAQAYGADVQASRAGGRAGAIVTGKSQAESVIDLPKIESSSEKVVGLVNELLNHKGKSAALGASSYLPSIRGTDRAGFDNRLKQIQGDAFLKAFESLKGGGAITEIEGQKATQALNRMNETVSESEFDAAAKDFISEVNRFKEIAAQKAGKAPEKGLTGQDKQAYDWAKSNPNDPRSAQILNKLGAQ